MKIIKDKDLLGTERIDLTALGINCENLKATLSEEFLKWDGKDFMPYREISVEYGTNCYVKYDSEKYAYKHIFSFNALGMTDEEIKNKIDEELGRWQKRQIEIPTLVEDENGIFTELQPDYVKFN